MAEDKLDTLSDEILRLMERVDTLEAGKKTAERTLKDLTTPRGLRTRDDRIPFGISSFDIKDAVFRPHAQITTTNPETFAAGTQIVQMNAMVFDNNFMANLASQQLVCRTAGIYLVQGGLVVTLTGTIFNLFFYKNSAVQDRDAVSVAAGSTAGLRVGKLIRLNVSDTLTLKVIRGDAADVTYIAGAILPFLEAIWIAPAPNTA